MIAALLQKDLKLYARNRLYSFLTVFGLVAYIAIYFLVPATTDEALGVGLVIQTSPDHPLIQALGEILEESIVLPDQDALMARLEEGELAAGLVITQEFLDAIMQGQPVELPLYLAPGTPASFREAMTDLFTIALNSAVSGGRLELLESQEEVLGPDLVGEPLSIRQRLLPMLVFFVMLIETLGLAALMNQEVVADTARALLVTPLRTSQFFVAKALMGVGLAVIQVLILLAVTGQWSRAPLQVGVLILLASLMMTGLAFLIAGIARDYMGVLSWGVVFILPMVLPALAVIFPGLASRWMEWIPSFFLVDGLHRALNFQVPLADLARDLLGLTGVSLVFLGAGTLLLRRRFV